VIGSKCEKTLQSVSQSSVSISVINVIFRVSDTYWTHLPVFPSTLATLFTYRQALALQQPIGAVTQGTFYCWVDVLLAELASSVLYNPIWTSGTRPTCPALERRLHDERISLASCLPCKSHGLYLLSLFGLCCLSSPLGLYFSCTVPALLVARSSTFRYQHTISTAMPGPRPSLI
jgi:hypothetical protein